VSAASNLQQSRGTTTALLHEDHGSSPNHVASGSDSEEHEFGLSNFVTPKHKPVDANTSAANDWKLAETPELNRFAKHFLLDHNTASTADGRYSHLLQQKSPNNAMRHKNGKNLVGSEGILSIKASFSGQLLSPSANLEKKGRRNADRTNY